MTQPRPSEASCRQAASRTAKWAAPLVQAVAPGEAHFVALSAYKGLAGFDAAGDSASARQLARLFAANLSRPGDFQPLQDMGVGAALASPWPHLWSNLFARALKKPLSLVRSYRNAWVAYGMFRLGEKALCESALDRLELAIHPALGAIAHSDLLPHAAGFYDMGSNASATHALLAAGRTEAALRLGGFLKRLVMAQAADTARIRLGEDERGQAVTVASPQLQKQYRIEVGAPDQAYWMLGFALKVFAQLFKATGESGWLDPSARILAWLGRAHADFATNITCAKLSWGTAEMFAATGDSAWEKIALTALCHMLDTQNADGVWLRPDFPRWLAQPLFMSLDVSLERMFYLLEVPRSLREGGMPLAA